MTPPLKHRGITIRTGRVPSWRDFALPGAFVFATVLLVGWALLRAPLFAP